jgi:Transposase IS200 like
MVNHYHLQIETPQDNLSGAIQWLNVSYSIWFNRKYQRVGLLFQGRFKTVLHEPSTQALVINRYIHLNAVRISRLGGHEEGSGQATNELSAELAKALYVARHHSDRTLRELAQLIGGKEYPAVTMAIRRLERRLKFQKDLAKKMQRILKLLQVKT